MSDNPYSPPSLGADPAAWRPPPSLMIPAICLIVLSSIWFLLVCVASPPVIFRAYREFSASQEPEERARKLGEIAGAAMAGGAMALAQAVVIYGSICMIRLRGYGGAMTAAIVSVIPLCSACYLLGIPFGIWALILLLRPEVKAAFR